MPAAQTTGDTLVDAVLGSDVPYITYAVPFFFVLIALEAAFAALAGRRLYRVADSFADLSCGILDQTTKIFLEGVVLVVYIALYENFRMFDVVQWSAGAKWLAFVLLFLGVDFCFYWHHRFCHEWALGWAAHVVHHQSEEFNLVVALRQSALEHHLAFFFYLPLALFGFPATWFLAMFAFNLIWQFWCHTRLVGKLGPIEWVFNTPSHHRVHHGRNPKYLDKNYAGTLIVWDRLFGTFQEEEEEPVYGVTRPLRSWNPLWANLAVWWELAQTARAAPDWRDKVRIWFMPLGWTPRGLEPKPDPPEVSPETVVKYHTKIPKSLIAYGGVHFLGAFAASFAFLILAEHKNLRELLRLWDVLVFMLLSLLSIGGVFELKRWALPVEIGRLGWLVFVAASRAWATPAAGWATALAFLAAVASAAWILGYRGWFRFGVGEAPAPTADPFGLKPAVAP
jgi:sterol desaturase/sphingolipid hydroxylase (fatty acid hydroxylase superfamily)